MKKGKILFSLILVLVIGIILILSISFVSASLLDDIGNWFNKLFGTQSESTSQQGKLGTIGVMTSGTAPLYRLWNPGITDHFYTTSETARSISINNNGYVDEGNEGYVYTSQVSGTTPLYRLWNPGITDHFYTTSESTKDDSVNNNGYTYEGIEGYIYTSQVSGTIHLYNLWNPGITDHFYTTSDSEKDTSVNNNGYYYGGIEGYVLISDCTPIACSQLGKSCGNWGDGCGGTLNCGTCSTGQTCNTNGQCVCTAETNPAFCSRLGKNCQFTGNDNCGTSRTVNCGSCATGQTCSNGVCASSCTAETNTQFCSRLAKNCGSVTANNNCGTSRTVNCGSCPTGQSCSNGVCASSCTAETNTQFCSRLAKNCGSVTANNNCGTSRTVNCGSCASPQTCTNNVCSCTAETNSAFCSRLGKNCQFSGNDNCGTSRSVNCGTCPAGQSCFNGVCASSCTAETNSAFCSRLGKNCGTVSSYDNCGTSRTVNCGICPTGQTCQTGVCVSSCTNDCSSSGAKRCNGQYSQTCANFDSDSCLEWGGDIDCTNGCNSTTGQCKQQSCNPLTCSQLGKSCGDWNNGCVGTINCGGCSSGQTCNSNGQCILSCTNDCSSSGAKRCDVQYSQTCSNYDSDSCLEWGGDAYCSNGCSSSTGQCNQQSCIPTCSGRQCGGDGCGRSCGTCGGSQNCNSAGQCINNCYSCLQLGKSCGNWDNECGTNINCGTCTGGQTCNSAGQCINNIIPLGLRGNYGFLTDFHCPFSPSNMQEMNGKIDTMMDVFGIKEFQFQTWFATYSSPTDGMQWTDAYIHRDQICRDTLTRFINKIHSKGGRAWAYVLSVGSESTTLPYQKLIDKNTGQQYIHGGKIPTYELSSSWADYQVGIWAPAIKELGFDGIHWDTLGAVSNNYNNEKNGAIAFTQRTYSLLKNDYGLSQTMNFVDLNYWDRNTVNNYLEFPYVEIWSSYYAYNYYDEMSYNMNGKWGVMAMYPGVDVPVGWTESQTMIARWNYAPNRHIVYLLVGNGDQRMIGRGLDWSWYGTTQITDSEKNNMISSCSNSLWSNTPFYCGS